MYFLFFFFFKQKTAYEIVSRDWSSDVCSSDLFSTLAAHYSGFKSIARYVVVLCLWITLSRGALDISSLLNKFQLGLLLYIATGISVGLGYLGSIFFNLDLDLNLNF